MSDADNKFMQLAVRLAEKGIGYTLPNPMVGAIIVKNGKIIGRGYHKKVGEPHAEIEALNDCKVDPKGATLFVTMEPCQHFGRTPPCTKAIVKSGIGKVVIAVLDPSKKNHSKGVKELNKAGIKTKVGILRKEAEELNKMFFTFHKKQRPFITLKTAISLDFKIAETRTKRTHLTSKKDEKFTHFLRHSHQAILVGAGTVIADNPHLGVRAIKGKDPLRIILTNKRPLHQHLKIFRDKNFLIIKNKTIPEVLKILHEKGIVSVLVEGGQRVFTSFIKAHAVDEIIFLLSPLTLGKDAVDFMDINN